MASTKKRPGFTVIRGGKLLDSKKRRAVSADILIKGDTIAEIGRPGLAAPSGAVAIDATTGWHKTLSNVEIAGMTGLAVPVSWGLDDTTTDAALLNSAPSTTLGRKNGWRFWGSRTTSAETSASPRATAKWIRKA